MPNADPDSPKPFFRLPCLSHGWGPHSSYAQFSKLGSLFRVLFMRVLYYAGDLKRASNLENHVPKPRAQATEMADLLGFRVKLQSFQGLLMRMASLSGPLIVIS